jgi:antitoxin component HigA of HigAB toxin-antitoxin module
MDVRPIRTEADYDAALKEISQYFEMNPNQARLRQTALMSCQP